MLGGAVERAAEPEVDLARVHDGAVDLRADDANDVVGCRICHDDRFRRHVPCGAVECAKAATKRVRVAPGDDEKRRPRPADRRNADAHQIVWPPTRSRGSTTASGGIPPPITRAYSSTTFSVGPRAAARPRWRSKAREQNRSTEARS